MIGVLFRAWRRENRIDIRSAASIVGVNHSTLSRLENGGAVDQKNMMVLLNWLFALPENTHHDQDGGQAGTGEQEGGRG